MHSQSTVLVCCFSLPVRPPQSLSKKRTERMEECAPRRLSRGYFVQRTLFAIATIALVVRGAGGVTCNSSSFLYIQTMDFLGADITNSVQANLAACIAYCCSISNCDVFMYSLTVYGIKTCYAKKFSGYTPRPCADCTVGVKNGLISVSPTPSPTQSVTSSSTGSRTPSQTQSASPTRSASQTKSVTTTQSASSSVTSTPTGSNTQTLSRTPTLSATASSTPSSSQASSSTGSVTRTRSEVPTPSGSGSKTQTPSPSETISPSQTRTDSRSETVTQTLSGTQAQTVSQSHTQDYTISQTKSTGGTDSRTPSMSATASESITVPPLSLSSSASGSQSATTSQSSSSSNSASPSQSQSATNPLLVVPSWSQSASQSQSPSESATASATSSASLTSTSSSPQSSSGSGTASVTDAPSQTLSPSQSASRSATMSPSQSQSASESATSSETASKTSSPSRTQSFTGSRTTSQRATRSRTTSASETASPSPHSTRSATTTASTSDTASQTWSESTSASASSSASPSCSLSTSASTSGTASQTDSSTTTAVVTPSVSNTVLLLATRSRTQSPSRNSTSSPSLLCNSGNTTGLCAPNDVGGATDRLLFPVLGIALGFPLLLFCCLLAIVLFLCRRRTRNAVEKDSTIVEAPSVHEAASFQVNPIAAETITYQTLPTFEPLTAAAGGSESADRDKPTYEILGEASAVAYLSIPVDRVHRWKSPTEPGTLLQPTHPQSVPSPGHVESEAVAVMGDWRDEYVSGHEALSGHTLCAEPTIVLASPHLAQPKAVTRFTRPGLVSPHRLQRTYAAAGSMYRAQAPALPTEVEVEACAGRGNDWTRSSSGPSDGSFRSWQAPRHAGPGRLPNLAAPQASNDPTCESRCMPAQTHVTPILTAVLSTAATDAGSHRLAGVERRIMLRRHVSKPTMSTYPPDKARPAGSDFAKNQLQSPNSAVVKGGVGDTLFSTGGMKERGATGSQSGTGTPADDRRDDTHYPVGFERESGGPQIVVFWLEHTPALSITGLTDFSYGSTSGVLVRRVRSHQFFAARGLTSIGSGDSRGISFSEAATRDRREFSEAHTVSEVGNIPVLGGERKLTRSTTMSARVAHHFNSTSTSLSVEHRGLPSLPHTPLVVAVESNSAKVLRASLPSAWHVHRLQRESALPAESTYLEYTRERTTRVPAVLQHSGTSLAASSGSLGAQRFTSVWDKTSAKDHWQGGRDADDARYWVARGVAPAGFPADNVRDGLAASEKWWIADTAEVGEELSHKSTEKALQGGMNGGNPATALASVNYGEGSRHRHRPARFDSQTRTRGFRSMLGQQPHNAMRHAVDGVDRGAIDPDLAAPACSPDIGRAYEQQQTLGSDSLAPKAAQRGHKREHVTTGPSPSILASVFFSPGPGAVVRRPRDMSRPTATHRKRSPTTTAAAIGADCSPDASAPHRAFQQGEGLRTCVSGTARPVQSSSAAPLPSVEPTWTSPTSRGATLLSQYSSSSQCRISRAGPPLGERGDVDDIISLLHS